MFFQFGLINDQPNLFFSYIPINCVCIKGCTAYYLYTEVNMFLVSLSFQLNSMMTKNCFSRTVEALPTPISSWKHCKRFSPLQTSNKLRPVFEPAQNLSLAFVECCTVVITTTPQCHNKENILL